MAKFDGDGDGKLDYQVLKPVFNIERMLKFFSSNKYCFLKWLNCFKISLLQSFTAVTYFQEFKMLLRHKKGKNRSGSVH